MAPEFPARAVDHHAVVGRDWLLLASAGVMLALNLPVMRGPGQPRLDNPSVSSRSVAIRVDLNRDPWWKLATLPGIGRTRAKAIIELRETGGGGTTFREAGDIARVRGIGPKTAARLAPFVQFQPTIEERAKPGSAG